MGLFSSSTRNLVLSTSKDVDVAVSKATRSYLPDDCPKEKHVMALKGSLESGVQRSYVAISLLNRLHVAKDWVTAVKTSVVIHRLIRETQPATLFLDELCKAGGAGARMPTSGTPSTITTAPSKRRVYPLHMDAFLDTKAAEGKYDFSEWVRAYCKFIDESLDLYHHTGWTSRLETSSKESVLRSMSTGDLLETLPRVQRVQRRLIDCRPTGAACQNDNTLLALTLVVRESFKLYKAISEGIINLADNFSRMDYAEGLKALEIYNEACQGCEDLQIYLGQLGQLDSVKRVVQFPKLEAPPRDFLQVMKGRLRDLKDERRDLVGLVQKEPLRLRRGPAGSIPPPLSTSLSLPLSSKGQIGSGIVVGTSSVTSVEDTVVQDEDVAVPDGAEWSLLDFGESSARVGPHHAAAAREADPPSPQPPNNEDDPFKDRDAFDLLSDIDFTRMTIK